MFCRKLALGVLLSWTCAAQAPTHFDILRGEYGRYRANNDLLFYHLDVRVDPEKKFIGGKNTIRFKIGDKVKGKVGKLAAFGAFVELDGGIDGLVHISQISEDRIEKVKDVLKVGQELEARVIKVDKAERRIGLSIKAANYSSEQLAAETSAYEAMNRNVSNDMMNLGDILDEASKKE